MKLEKRFAKKFFSPLPLIFALGGLLTVSLLFSLGMMKKEDDHFLTKTIETSEGRICYMESQGTKDCIVFIHGNSTSKEVFSKQFKELGQKYNLIAFDLPGHGASQNAHNPKTVYSFPGYAKIMIEALEKMGKKDITFCGWSLGGHIAIEILKERPDLVSKIMLIATPPIPLTPEGLSKGFREAGNEAIGQEAPFIKEQAINFLKGGGEFTLLPLLSSTLL